MKWGTKQVAGAVRLLFSDFARQDEPAEDNAGRIYDANGNKVGSWSMDAVDVEDEDEA